MNESSSSRMGWRPWVVLVGLSAALVLFYWAHKPFDPALIYSLGGAGLDLLSAGLVITVAGGLGRRFMDRAGLIAPSRAERVGLDGLFGLGVLGWLALLIGLAGLYRSPVFYGLLLVLASFSFRPLIGWLRDVFQLVRVAFLPDGRWDRLLTIFIAFMLLTALLHALMPPTGFDALNYHLVGPRRYLEAGAVTAQPDNHFLGFPQGVEILYGLAIGLLGRDTAAAPLHFFVGILGLLTIAGLLKQAAGSSTARLAMVLLLGSYSLWLLFGWPYVDLAAMAYGATVLSTAARWRESGEERWLMLAGALAGLALGVKYTAVGLVLALGIFALLTAPRRVLRSMLLIGIPAVLVFLPWAIKGWLLYGNPVYPFIFGGLNWDALRAYTFSTPGTGLLGSVNAWQLPLLPLAATVFGVEKGDLYSFTSGPWLLTAPLLLIPGRALLRDGERALARDCYRLGLPLLAFWMVMAASTSIGAQTRLMTMALPVAAVAGALGFHSLSRWPRHPLDVAFLARALIAVSLVFGALDVLQETAKARFVPYLLGQVSRQEYLLDQLGAYRLAMDRLADLPAGTRVRLLFEPRTYYCPVHVICQGDILFDHWFRPLRQGLTPDEVFRRWQEGGDDYILLFNPGYAFQSGDSRFRDENALFPAALTRSMERIWSDPTDSYTLYGWSQHN